MSGGEEVGFLDRGRVYLVVVGLGTPVLGAIMLAMILTVWPNGADGILVIVGVDVLLAIFAVARAKRIRRFLGAKLRPLADVTVLGVLVAWGLFYNTAARSGESPTGHAAITHLALAEPEVFGLVGLHTLAVLAYVVSRLRPMPLRDLAELLVHALLMAGIVLHALVAMQLGGLVMLGILPPLLPFAMPLLITLVYAEEIVLRLRRCRAEARVQPAALHPALPQVPRIERPPLAGAFALSRVVLAVWTGAQKVLVGWAPLQAFTRTYGYTFSTLTSPFQLDPVRGHD